MLERPVPDWIALPGLAVTRMNLLEGFQVGWRHVCTWTGDAALHLAPFAEVSIDFARLWSR